MKFGVPLTIAGLLLGVGSAFAQAPQPDTYPMMNDAPKAKAKAAPAKPAAAATKAAPASPEETAAAGAKFDAELGWTVATDPATGVRIGLPAKMVPVTRDLANGTLWSSRHGDVLFETFRIKTTEAIKALFEQSKREPATRKTEYSLLKDDNFFVSGLQGLKKFSMRAQLKDGELRGVTVLYDQAIEGIVAPIAVATTTTFVPFPDTSAPYAALSKRVEYGTGIVVSNDGYLIADRKITDNCHVIVASGIGNADRIAADEASGVALLRVYGSRNLTPATLSAEAPKAGDLTLVGVPDPNTQDGERKLSEVKAKLTDGAAIELRQPVPVAGFSGAAALDKDGRLLGMMQTRNTVVASAEELLAPPVRLVAAGTIRNFLAAHSVTAAASGADPKASVVRVICVRK